MSLKEYKHGDAFAGVIGRTVAESSPAWPEPNRAKAGSPNVIFFVLDDVGYGDSTRQCTTNLCELYISYTIAGMENKAFYTSYILHTASGINKF